MTKLKVLVVEDEPIIQEHLCESIEEFGYEVCARFDEGESAINYLRSSMPDLALLDISLGGKLNGIDVAQFIKEKKQIPFLFISSYSDSKTLDQAKITMPSGYIVKPFEDSDIKTSIEIALYNHSKRNVLSQFERNELADISNANKLFFKIKNEFVPIDIQDITWIEAKENYCQIVTINDQHLLSNPLGRLAEKLPDRLFIRIHKSFIINLTRIEKVSYANVTIAGEPIPIGRAYREKLKASLRFF